MSESYGFEIDVPVRNEWANVTLLVTSVQNCFHAMFGDLAGSHNIAMITGELLENAIKYGDWSAGELHRLRLKITGEGTKARVTVENPASAGQFSDVEGTLAWIKQFPSADEAYRARLLALAQTADPEVSKLGLVRIAYEGRCALVAEYADGDIRVTAEMTLAP